MLNFIVFDFTGKRLGAFQIIDRNLVLTEDGPELNASVLQYWQTIYNRDGEEGLRRYMNSLEAHNSGYIFKENRI